jgi:hypothetical protein
LPQDAGECLGTQFVSWLSGHSDDAWLRRMSVLSMRSSSAGMNPTITLDELQDRCNFHQRRMLMPGGRLIRTFLKDRVARIGSSVSCPAHCPRRGGQLRRGTGRSPTTPDLPVRGLGAGRSSSCSSAAGVAHEFEVPASGDMAHAQISKRRDVPSLTVADLNSLVLAGAVRRGCATRERLPGDHRVTNPWLLPIERDSPRRSLNVPSFPVCLPGWAGTSP